MAKICPFDAKCIGCDFYTLDKDDDRMVCTLPDNYAWPRELTKILQQRQETCA